MNKLSWQSAYVNMKSLIKYCVYSILIIACLLQFPLTMPCFYLQHLTTQSIFSLCLIQWLKHCLQSHGQIFWYCQKVISSWLARHSLDIGKLFWGFQDILLHSGLILLRVMHQYIHCYDFCKEDCLGGI